jgi:peptide/nickel transport system substrate-binding protein
MYKTALGASFQTNSPVLDTLLTANDKGKPEPYLAQSYKINNGGKTITFYLRHNVKYSNGHQLVAADVKADFERAINPNTKSPFSASLLTQVTSIDVPSKYTVRINLSAPNRPFLTNLTTDYLGIMDPKSVAAAGSNGCNGLGGSGPFKITSVAPSFSSVREARNPLHTYGPSWAHNHGPAYLSSLTFTPITSDTTAVSELLAGQVDITDVPGAELSRVQGNKNITLHRQAQQGSTFLEFNSGRPPFNNVAVRRAVAEAIDRKALVAASLSGLGKPSTSVIPPTMFGYDPGSSKYAPKLDLAAARAAIAAAHATGPYTLLTLVGYGGEPAGELIQGELAQVGMQVNVVVKSVPDWVAQFRKEDFDMGIFVTGWFDPDVFYSEFDSSQRNGGLNYTNMTDPTLDKLLLAGRTTLNLKKAKADYYAVQKLIDTKVYADPLWVPLTVYGVRNRVQGWHINPSSQIQYQDLWVK